MKKGLKIALISVGAAGLLAGLAFAACMFSNAYWDRAFKNINFDLDDLTELEGKSLL